MYDEGFGLTLAAMRRHLAAMPCRSYELRLIHAGQHRAYPGERHWPADQLLEPATVGFLRARNRAGYDIYFRPEASRSNAGFILVDLDDPPAGVGSRMGAAGHEPCALIQTSPGRLQSWVWVSRAALPLGQAGAISRQLAALYGGDRASTDGRHLGRLAGFTNQKPARRLPSGWPPWVRVLFAEPRLARGAPALLREAARAGSAPPERTGGHTRPSAAPLAVQPRSDVQALYQDCLQRLGILQRYAVPDWSIVDKWVAKELLRSGRSRQQVGCILAQGSPGFPRRHGHPEDYLRRTLERALRELAMPIQT